MKTLIKNGTVITMDNKRNKQYELLDILIEDDNIVFVGKNYDSEYDSVVDATNKIVMPGLINCHTHLGMSIFRATNDNMQLMDWLTNKIWPLEDKMTDEDIYYTTLLSCIEMIKTGSVMSNDQYFGSNGSIKAIIDSKTRSLFSRCLMDNDNNGELRINEFKELYFKYKENDLIKFSVSPHSLYTSNKEYLIKCKKVADELDLPIHIHFCENIDEVETIKKDYNVLYPSDALKDLGYLENKLILGHGTFLAEHDLQIFKDHDVSIVHNPISNLNLGCGVADVTKYRQFVNVSLGTDGQGSGNNMNLFYHMSVVDLIQKGIKKDPTIMNSYEVLKMATLNGAKALGVDNLIGSIEVGKKADIIILDLNNLEVYPTVDIITQVVHNVESCNVDTVFINGEILLKDHKLLLDINEDKLKLKINGICNRLAI